MSITISSVNMQARRELGLKSGDTVRVSQKIQEKGKTRLQVFEGLVLGRKHGNEAGARFSVRKISSGVGIERVFPLYSPLIEKIEIIRRAKVRRAKLNYIREKATKEVKRQLRRAKIEYLTTEREDADTTEYEKISDEKNEEEEKEEKEKSTVEKSM